MTSISFDNFSNTARLALSRPETSGGANDSTREPFDAHLRPAPPSESAAPRDPDAPPAPPPADSPRSDEPVDANGDTPEQAAPTSQRDDDESPETVVAEEASAAPTEDEDQEVTDETGDDSAIAAVLELSSRARETLEDRPATDESPPVATATETAPDGDAGPGAPHAAPQSSDLEGPVAVLQKDASEADAVDASDGVAAEATDQPAREVEGRARDVTDQPSGEEDTDDGPRRVDTSSDVVIEEAADVPDATESPEEVTDAVQEPRPARRERPHEPGAVERTEPASVESNIARAEAATSDLDTPGEGGRDRSPPSSAGPEKITTSNAPTGSTADAPAAAAPAAPPKFAEHLLARGGDRASRGGHVTAADSARFVDRVARAFQAAEGRESPIRLRLSPPELGSLRLELRVQSGALTAHVEAETPAARTLLLDNLPVLRERLAEQGVRIEQFDVDLLDRQPGGAAQQQTRQRDNAPARPEPAARRAGENSLAEIDSPASPTRGDGQLNVIV